MDKITKTLDENELEIKSIDEKKRIIWHKITKEVADRMGDIVRIDGMDLKRFKKKPGVLYGHNYAGLDPIPVIARNVGFKQEGKALYAGTQFLPTTETEPSQKLRDLINDNWMLHKMKLMGWSVGFIPKAKEEIEQDGKLVGYDYKESELLEYSSVIIPAHQDAINDAIEKGLISKGIVSSLSKEEKLPGEIAEDQLISMDIGKTAEDFEEELITKPSKDNHVCQINNGEYTAYRSEKRSHKGKPYTVRFGKRKSDDKMEEYEYFYPVEHWSESEAKSHCKNNKGKFEAATGKECEDCGPLRIELAEPEEQGLSPDLIKMLSEKIDSIVSRRKKLKEYLENLKRR